MRLPGMPAQIGRDAPSEADGLISINPGSAYREFYLLDSVRVVMDDPAYSSVLTGSQHHLIIYALPNGNSIEWTMGKLKNDRDDWHYNIQYIDAQTKWLRKTTRDRYTLVYLEAPQLSWPAWKRSHSNYGELITQVTDSLRAMYPRAIIMLNSHSGGGSFINAFIETRAVIPDWVRRIGFIDSNYGYNSETGAKLITWLRSNQDKRLTVFAYNDSIALYEGKPFVSATGGTWYRSKMMLNDLGQALDFTMTDKHAGIIQYRSSNNQVLILLKQNPRREIFHTEQVELNGFIHSILFGTKVESIGYMYFGERCYDGHIQTETPIFSY